MAQGDSLSTHIFGLEMGGIQVESVQEVSGLSVEEDVVESNFVTTQGIQVIRKQPGARRSGEVVITRGLDKSDAFTKWIDLTLNEGQVDEARKELTIEIKDTKKETVRRINLFGCWASKWEGPSFKAGESAAATERVTIVFEEIKVQ
ncbi:MULTISPECIES: phage tail protein [Actinoalloteichus]|uniref:Conserved hypothetical phage tail region protein n=1 Tax=Actinoalloteichus fjordicus TaxID=1612552 RepID=A0AAC9LEI4_9PSEU|nr:MULTISPECIES: phage tail protein [Actinoalloteichus]APU16182.1 conserved hypothetical phage tail region protein [Actinoalloteichus fjordicus]APU22244.1 conserved hypothetical phage tail region protein [Actinoalloteichus sp. GBA129-24]